MATWTLAQGKDSEQTLAGSVAAGATQIALAGADLVFSIGELLFLSEGDGTELEFLGEVTAVSTSDVDFSLAVLSAKGSGGRLWKPTRSHRLGGDVRLPEKIRVETGVVTERSLGGVAYSIRTAQEAPRLEWKIEDLTPKQEEELLTFLAVATAQAGGFTIVDADRMIRGVYLGTTPYDRIRSQGEARRVELTLQLEAESTYL